MAELKPVPGQILLTDREFDALRDSARKTLQNSALEAQESLGTSSARSAAEYRAAREVVEAVMARLNQQRCGDPAGVIRRSKNGSIAVREQRDDATLHWNLTYVDDADLDALTAQEIRSWECIHVESWRNRLCEHDFPKTAPKDSEGPQS